MKNASLTSKTETPKTPGGISKSLLTPCRRVGLSRNWKKNVASPFNSPLAGTELKQDNVETRKRKETLEESPQNSKSDCNEPEIGTPSRKVELPRRKKSKTLLSSITKTAEDDSALPVPPELPKQEKVEDSEQKNKVKDDEVQESKVVTPVCLISNRKSKCNVTNNVHVEETKDSIAKVTTPVRSKSKNKNKKTSPKSIISEVQETTKPNEIIDIEKENFKNSNKSTENKLEVTNTEKANSIKQNKSPNDLTKECIVVLQKKIFKKQLKENAEKHQSNEKQNAASQALFNDSDSDDIPLNCVNKKETKADETITIDDDENDFAISKPQVKKSTSKSSMKNIAKPKSIVKPITKDRSKAEAAYNAPSQSSIEDDDDFVEKKRTILVRKTYDKVIKPSKAKSTGSITQKDIEDLKARIEVKKKMLLAKSLTDTKDLRDLIKKWQKGCQDALMELMDLMKNKCPDQNMEYSQILQTLKIPATLVGYDSDNDCFVTPEDENIILSHIE